MSAPPRLALFDLDRTLIRDNSAGLWVLYEWRGGRVSTLQTLRAMAYLAGYSIGFSKVEDAIRESVSTLAGQPERELIERTRAFYDEHVRPKIRVRAREVVAEHRTAGDHLVLCTSSSRYLSELVQADLGLDHVLCTRFEVDARGLFTGRIVGPLGFGAGKLTQAMDYAQGLGARLEDAAFYSDSASDLPLLAAVGRPVVVSPDPRLRRLAKARGWPIRDWG